MVDSGVPQGSVLGPILFLIYVDDAARALDCEVAMFADDMKIWSLIRGPADEDRLQMNLNRLEEWSNRWLLRFNVAKCSILRLGNTARSASTRVYFLGGAALQEVEAQRDLGVLTTSSLKPSAHCSRVAKTAMSVLTYFTFDGTIYEQVEGTPMGSPISGFIAEAVLQRLESLVFQHHRPKFWARYVDDTFVVIERDQVLTFQEHLNAVFPDIQFTMEEEENNQLAFLHVLVCRKDCGRLKTKVFRKAINTMQVLNFNRNHPISHKRSCVRTLYRRVETHCSEPEDKIAELQYLRRVFKANGYPRNFVDRCIRKRDERPNRTDTKSWRALPYVKNVSEAVGRLLAPLGVGVAHRPEATIRRLIMKPKDPLPRLETSGVVYQIWCSCGQSNYVGETGRQLRTRMAEHAAAVRRNDASSQVAAHSTRSGYTFKFDEAEILARGDNRVSRELLESWFTGPQSINKCNDLPIQYSVLRLRLGGVIGHAGSALVNTLPNTRVNASDGRAIITPTSNARDEIAAIIDSNVSHQAMITPSVTIPDEGRAVNVHSYAVAWLLHPINTAAPCATTTRFCSFVSDDGFE
nr:unnamed protein product [Spirometra erinaceieuropaei]